MSRKLPKSIKQEEFFALVKKTRKNDKQARLAFILAFGAGMRLSETLHVKAEDIDEERKSILIREGKGSKDRVVPLPKGWRSEMKAWLPIKKSARSLERNFKIAARRAKLNQDYTFHSLRHGFATRCIEAGVPINQVQLLLGHSNVSTTSIYIQANPTDALKKYEELF